MPPNNVYARGMWQQPTEYNSQGRQIVREEEWLRALAKEVDIVAKKGDIALVKQLQQGERGGIIVIFTPPLSSDHHKFYK